MGSSFMIDATEFNKTIDRYLDLTRKDRLNELNRRAANICARATGLTPRADIDQIVDDLKATETVVASYIKETKRRGQYVALSKGGKTTQKKSTVGYMGSAEAFKIANWRLARGKRMGFYGKFPAKFAGPGRGKKGGTASQFYQSFVKRARSSAGYLASGWLPAYYHFARIAKGKKLEPDSVIQKFFTTLKGSAGKGFGISNILGSGDYIKAIFVNSAAGVGKIGKVALQRAINEEEADMKIYLARKEQELVNKANMTR